MLEALSIKGHGSSSSRADARGASGRPFQFFYWHHFARFDILHLDGWVPDGGFGTRMPRIDDHITQHRRSQALGRELTLLMHTVEGAALLMLVKRN